MLRAGVDGLAEGARDAGHRARRSRSAVTVLTSDPNVDALDARMQLARDAGCDGVVCAGTDVALARAYALAHDGARHPARRVATPTIRRVSTRPVTRSRVARTGW